MQYVLVYIILPCNPDKKQYHIHNAQFLPSNGPWASQQLPYLRWWKTRDPSPTLGHISKKKQTKGEYLITSEMTTFERRYAEINYAKDKKKHLKYIIYDFVSSFSNDKNHIKKRKRPVKITDCSHESIKSAWLKILRFNQWQI